MRNIGHEVLLSAGDSSSRVLPVNKTADDQYLITFGNAFQFTPDSVIRIIRQAVAANNLPSDYVVNVVESEKNQVVFGFAILQTEKTSIVPCKGRKQPKARYLINIAFRDTALSKVNKNYIVGAGGSLAVLTLIFSGLKINYRQNTTHLIEEKGLVATYEVIAIGNYWFYTDDQYLTYNKEQTLLSDKESKMLYILARKPNVLVERGELQKVWEDEGVIVSRSLDMFISKLRKKLENDPNVRLVNVHG
ncbi:hypothetical protein GCM10011425_08660 [Mucilaginibacter galii]|uniref:OmpR/PhoB-type domain-containing protein n=2 Tax=Mucilaginibacter galii TaxID=2005073 RepID=A0A917N0Q4_9SPHI|nr:hypothetical protein GCM10011425_08660 [Mucilaginibacter galii]